MSRHLRSENLFRFLEWRGHGGSFLFVGEVRILGRVRLSRLFCGREAQGKTLEGESPLFRRRGSLPPNLPLSPRTSPHVPPLTKRKFVSLFRVAGTWGKFFCLSGRCGLVVECGFAHVLWAGCVGRAYAFHKCRLIPPHQSLTRQTACSFLPPEGKPFCKIPFTLRNMINELNFDVLFPTYCVLYTRYSRLYLLCMHGVKKASPRGEAVA